MKTLALPSGPERTSPELSMALELRDRADLEAQSSRPPLIRSIVLAIILSVWSGYALTSPVLSRAMPLWVSIPFGMVIHLSFAFFLHLSLEEPTHENRHLRWLYRLVSLSYILLFLILGVARAYLLIQQGEELVAAWILSLFVWAFEILLPCGAACLTSRAHREDRKRQSDRVFFSDFYGLVEVAGTAARLRWLAKEAELQAEVDNLLEVIKRASRLGVNHGPERARLELVWSRLTRLRSCHSGNDQQTVKDSV